MRCTVCSFLYGGPKEGLSSSGMSASLLGVKSTEAAPVFRYEYLFLADGRKGFGKLPICCIPVSVAVGGDASAGSGST